MVQDLEGGDFFFKFEDQPKATQDIIDSRISICDSCEFRNNDHCTQCGCTISVITQVKFSKCPLDKW